MRNPPSDLFHRKRVIINLSKRADFCVFYFPYLHGKHLYYNLRPTDCQAKYRVLYAKNR